MITTSALFLGLLFIPSLPNIRLTPCLCSRTHPSVNSVQLLGSWDNFSKCYKMERDSRRDRGQWRGCHQFQDTVPLGAKPKRTGGLTMGETYYYYYEVDGSTEVHDPSMPSTSVCPYLPGQTVNTLEVPIEHIPRRSRSASMNSIHPDDFKTMDPRDKFITPRPAPPAPYLFGTRLGTSDGIRLNHKSSSRSLSPAATPGWTGKARRLFGLRPPSRSSERTQTPDSIASEDTVSSARSGSSPDGTRSTTPSEDGRSRDLSLESLRKLLSDDAPRALPLSNQTQRLTIPDDIVEENEDDDNFATSAVSEGTPFTTLSPPPFQRSVSSSSTTGHKNDSTTTIVPEPTTTAPRTFYDGESVSDLKHDSLVSFRLTMARTHFPYSATSSIVASPISPQSVSSPNNNYSFFDELAEEDESASGTHDSRPDLQYRHNTFMAYSLPHSTPLDRKQSVVSAVGDSFGAPEIVAPTGASLPLESTSLLTLNGIDTGLDDLVSELGWIANAF